MCRAGAHESLPCFAGLGLAPPAHVLHLCLCRSHLSFRNFVSALGYLKATLGAQQGSPRTPRLASSVSTGNCQRSCRPVPVRSPSTNSRPYHHLPSDRAIIVSECTGLHAQQPQHTRQTHTTPARCVITMTSAPAPHAPAPTRISLAYGKPTAQSRCVDAPVHRIVQSETTIHTNADTAPHTHPCRALICPKRKPPALAPSPHSSPRLGPPRNLRARLPSCRCSFVPCSHSTVTAIASRMRSGRLAAWPPA